MKKNIGIKDMCNTIKGRGRCEESKLCTWEEKEKRLKELEKLNRKEDHIKIRMEKF